MWSFADIRSYVIKQIDDNFAHQDALDMIELALKCQVADWLHPSYVRLCDRVEPITALEGSRLGFERFAAIQGEYGLRSVLKVYHA
ncbi:hypothetical protein FRB99_007240, partial [Tulasnella sp. 403]